MSRLQFSQIDQPKLACDCVRVTAERDKIRAALEELVESYSMRNVGINASKRRLQAIKNARKLLAE